jgi:hypothetical protein
MRYCISTYIRIFIKVDSWLGFLEAQNVHHLSYAVLCSHNFNNWLSNRYSHWIILRTKIKMKIGIAIVHGIGRQDKSYADNFIKLIQEQYKKSAGKADLVFESICWQEEIEPLEHTLFEKIKNLGWKLLRSFFVGYGGDALCYQPSEVKENGFYTKVHKSVDKGLQNLAKSLDANSPICIISHSLGTVVVSNFIWDIQHNSSYYSASPEVQNLIKRLSLLYTMGSPLAIWSLRFPDGGEPIKLDESANWFNLYAHNDIISSPIKLINQQYNHMSNLYDFKFNVGGVLFGWNPLSHNSYWDSRHVIKHITNNLLKIKPLEEKNDKS